MILEPARKRLPVRLGIGLASLALVSSCFAQGTSTESETFWRKEAHRLVRRLNVATQKLDDSVAAQLKQDTEREEYLQDQLAKKDILLTASLQEERSLSTQLASASRDATRLRGTTEQLTTTCIVLAAALVLLACSLVVSFLWRRSHSDRDPSPSAKDDLQKWKGEAQSLYKRLDQVAQELAETASGASGLDDDMKKQLRQEIALKDRTLTTWDEVAIDFLDSLDRTAFHKSQTAEGREAVVRIREQFTKLIGRLGLDTILPDKGDIYIPGHHKIEQVIEIDNASTQGMVEQVLSVGYRRGDRIIRPAQIQIGGTSKA